MASKHIESEKTKLLPTTLEDLLIGWVRRLGGLAVLFISAAIWLSLQSWSASDPSLSVTSNQPPGNWLGAPGAAVADLLLNTIGLSAIVVLVICVVWGLQLLMSEEVEGFQVRAFFAAFAMLGIAGGSSALPTVDGWMFHHGYGGIIGDVVLNLIVGLLAQFQVSYADTLAGLSLFAVGFWAFSCAIGLDRKHIFLIIRPQGRAKKTLKSDQPSAQKQSWTKSAVGGAASVLRKQLHVAATPAAPTPDVAMAEPPSLAPARLAQKAPLQAPVQASITNVEQHDESIMGLKNRLESSVDQDARRIAKIFAPKSDEQAQSTVQPELPLQQPAKSAPKRKRDLPSFLMSDIEPELTDEPMFDDAPELRSGRDLEIQPGIEPAHEPITDIEVAGATEIRTGPAVKKVEYRQPSLEELSDPEPVASVPQDEALEHRATAAKLKRVLADFRITGDIANVKKGPVITLFEFVPSAGIKASRVVALADDIARSMSAASARISAMPGRNALAIEIPNDKRASIALKTLFNSDAFQNTDAGLPLMLGVDIVGEPIVTDLARMPHLLVAGTTGSGKSVGINAMILSLLYRRSPQNCKFLMIDPKMLELSAYNGIPHMLAPVVTDPGEAVEALRWAVGEMEERYKRMADLGVRNIESYNKRIEAARSGATFDVQTGFDPVSKSATFETRVVNLEPMPNIVIVVDEFADLMSVAGKEIEAAMQRLAQMARAAGMHLIMATQRPSVDVITGTLKANFPARLAYRVASKIDSRTILQEQGAEQLLGGGDMLLTMTGQPVLRIHGPMVTEEEIEAVTRSLGSDLRSGLSNVAQAA